jgi:hypothetical protein
MPPVGHKSIRIPESVYDNFYKQYEKQKHIVANKGIFSFSGYIIHLINESGKYEID